MTGALQGRGLGFGGKHTWQQRFPGGVQDLVKMKPGQNCLSFTVCACLTFMDIRTHTHAHTFTQPCQSVTSLMFCDDFECLDGKCENHRYFHIGCMDFPKPFKHNKPLSCEKLISSYIFDWWLSLYHKGNLRTKGIV